MKDILKSSYKKFNKNFQQEYLLNKEFKYFNKFNNILDVGCGEGDFISLKPKKIIGIDIDKNNLIICKKKKLNVKLGNATDIPFIKESFDGIHASHLVEHLMPAEVIKFLEEALRVLRPGGIVMISTPLMDSSFYDDISHIKPYKPESFRIYVAHNKHFKNLKEINFYWRYSLIPNFGKYLYFISNYLYKFGFHWFTKNGYTIIFKKVK